MVVGQVGVFIVIEYQVHCVVKVLETYWVKLLDRIVGQLPILDELVELLGRDVLKLKVEALGRLALFQVLVDATQVLPERRVVVVFDAVIRPSSYQ